MKPLATLGIATALSLAALASAQATSVSIGINQPGVYGRITLGDAPAPVIINSQPVIAVPAPVVVERRYRQGYVTPLPAPVIAQRAPIYMYVPTLQQQNWTRYCGRYSACNQPVHFVSEQWVRDRYEHNHPKWRGNNGRHRGHDRDDRHDHGRGNGHGHGKH